MDYNSFVSLGPGLRSLPRFVRSRPFSSFIIFISRQVPNPQSITNKLSGYLYPCYRLFSSVFIEIDSMTFKLPVNGRSGNILSLHLGN